MDGTKVADKNWTDSARQNGSGYDLVFINKAGKWDTAKTDAKFACVTCERMNGGTDVTQGK